MSRAYYNEIEPYAAAWLRNLVAAGLVPAGDVDERDIRAVQPSDLAGYAQCHFFAGIGGWAYAARLAGWPDDRPLWTGSCPCQPFSIAGRGEGAADPRHLWPDWFRLIAACRPPVIMGEQVAAAAGHGWLDGVRADLEESGYALGVTVLPACAVDAPHRRDRLWFVADGAGERGKRIALLDQPGTARSQAVGGGAGTLEYAGAGRYGAADQSVFTRRNSPFPHGFWSDAEWLVGADGKARRVEPGLRLLAHGVPARVGRLRALGNAIVPQVAAEVIGAFMDCRP